MPGFVIRCLDCGEEQRIVPGRRPYRNERIVFGTDNYGADHISCECGNALEEWSRFEGKQFDSEFVVEWRELSAKPTAAKNA
ncbi:hypothetical protein [Paenibacillus flagellatus]|uniref:Uncharacterized protein n=1 Tax=Paenibacillus flagellatus TaxID=2211139 RepID=A0A2V5KZV5_9BACL|nr:hypothetical protein [Paenibacillus flagellatus]PYI55766.1 hypothetical protein DLM86_08585 [Paenibacillus flagellatus]